MFGTRNWVMAACLWQPQKRGKHLPETASLTISTLCRYVTRSRAFLSLLSLRSVIRPSCHDWGRCQEGEMDTTPNKLLACQGLAG